MSTTLTLTEQLIACASVTPNDAGCQTLIADRLKKIGFDCATIASGGVTNLWARRWGSQHDGKLLVFAGHTDVVPSGPLHAWTSAPFEPTQRHGKLYGRGAADMKTSIACFIVAAEEFIAAYPQHAGSIALLITSDEEGPATHGTVSVIDTLKARGERLDYCIVGEPTCVATLGDTMKNGRRGSLSGKLTVRGIQGHIAYPQEARNPIHLVAPALAQLVAVEWDTGNAYFAPTTWQISNINAGTGATNVTPGELTVDFNFRFSPASTVDGLKYQMQTILEAYGLKPQQDYVIAWSLGGEPFMTPRGVLAGALANAIQYETGVSAQFSTAGGTSDGRFIVRICDEVIEFGPPTASMHQIDECVELNVIEPLKNIYRRVLEQLVT